MRITNGIMIRNSISNISINKKQVDTLNSQLSSEKKILRPSDDPIIAIRALRLRSTYSEVCQYLEKNIPDAQQWLKTTEDALSVTNSLITDFVTYCNQGISDYNNVSERQVLYSQLKQYRDEMFSTANADYAGRTVFTGYKTDKNLSFELDDYPQDKKYEITEKFDGSEIEAIKRITGGIDPDDVKEVYESDVQNNSIYRMRLAYKDIEATGATITGVELPDYVTVSTKTIEAYGDKVYNPQSSEIIIIPETGEVVMGYAAYQALKDKEGIKVEYTKDGFEQGDIIPEHYFDCKDISSDDPNEHVTYTLEKQEMQYQINFNQTIVVNTLGKDVFNVGMSREIDDMMESVYTAIEAGKTVEAIEAKIAATTNTDELKKLKTMLDAAKIQLAYAEDNMSNAFSEGVGKYQKYQDKVNLAIADIGTKSVRLTLNQERLELQKLNVADLKSQNEEIDTAEVAVLLTSASDVYDAALAAAGKIITKSLLDFVNI